MHNNIKILVWNCHSIYNKLSHFKDRLYASKPHVVCLTETWLKNNREPIFTNYTNYLVNRGTSMGGGIAILIRNDIIHVRKILT